MRKRLRDRLRFRLERWLHRGVLYQLLVIAGLIGLVAIIGGGLVLLVTDVFASAGDAIWWAFLRLTDPGYLGDDEGMFIRTVSTIITVLGYVLFMGSLIAIMTQWLRRTMEHLESGLTPIAINGHVLVLGWTNRTTALVRELALSEGRVKRFLRRRGIGHLRIVILADEVSTEKIHELRGDLGTAWDEQLIILRAGSSLQIDHLRRVDFMHASVIVLPGADYEQGGTNAMDARIIKTLMSISDYRQSENKTELPAIVTETFDADKLPIMEATYPGSIDVVPSNTFISRLMAQNVRHPGLSYVFDELLSHGRGNDLYVRSYASSRPVLFGELRRTFPKAILLGVLRPANRSFTPVLNPPDHFSIEHDDRMVLIAPGYEDTNPDTASPAEVSPAIENGVQKPSSVSNRRILILGWSGRAPALIHEFGSYPGERFTIDMLSTIPVAERRRHLAEALNETGERLRVQQLEGDYTDSAVVRKLHPSTYDNIVFLGSQRLASGEASDARTILGYMVLRRILSEDADSPDILLELMDPENARLFRHRSGEVLIAPKIISHVLAHVGLRRELSIVFDELFASGGAEVFFRPAAHYAVTGRSVSFLELQEIAESRQEIALGVRLKSDADGVPGGIHLNPPKSVTWTFEDEDEVVVLATSIDAVIASD